MKIKSDFAVLDVLNPESMPSMVKPSGIPVMIVGKITGANGRPDGISQEFCVDVGEVSTGKAAECRDLVSIIKRQIAFSSGAFGPLSRTEGICRHIVKEAAEVRASKGKDVSEWCDIMILAMDGAWRAGHKPEAIAKALVAKIAVNEGREWPAPKGEDQPVEHVRNPAITRDRNRTGAKVVDLAKADAKAKRARKGGARGKAR